MFLRRLALLCLIGLAGGLILLAGPRIMAGFELSAEQDTVRRMRADATGPAVGAILQAIQTRRDAATWDPGPRAQAELGEMLLTLAARPEAEDADRRDLAAEALEVTRAALIKSPTQPFTWTRYSQALALSTEFARMDARAAGEAMPAEETAPVDLPLSMAVVTGPWQADLVPTRVEMGLFFWYRLSDFTRRRIAGQIFIAARIDPERLAEVTRRQNALREVMAILLVDDELLQDFTRTYYYTQSIEMTRDAEETEQ